MAKLFPPILEKKLPAFIYDPNDNTEEAGKIRVWFQDNPSVSPDDYDNLSVRFKTITEGKDITLTAREGNITLYKDTAQFIFYAKDIMEKLGIGIGSYMKIQIAYIDFDGEIGYYSDVGIIKCSAQPIVEIKGLQADVVNNNFPSKFQGTYSNPNDPTEKEYSYCFELLENDLVIATSGEQIHNSSMGVDTWSPNISIGTNNVYTVKYYITTINNLINRENRTRLSATYNLTQRASINMDAPIQLSASSNNEEGIIELYLTATSTPPGELSYNLGGKFVLCRANENNLWEEITEFDICCPLFKANQVLLYKDYNVEHNKTYTYGLRAKSQDPNYNLSTNILPSNSVKCEFEYMYLYDGDKQLKIKFNPKVSSFKNTLLEQKIDTIGGTYPFVFRNGNVKYKEFPISGLISYLSDENEEFFPLDLYEGKTTSLTSYNYKSELDFKINVLEWLTNGKEKLFRSPTEGNYIVRLMNTSLSPNDTLGRLLHTFSCTAYEVAQYNIPNLLAHGLLNLTFPKHINDDKQLVYYEVGNQGNSGGRTYHLKVTGPAGAPFVIKTETNAGVQEEHLLSLNQTGVYELTPDILTNYYIIAVSSTNSQVKFLLGKKFWVEANNIDKYDRILKRGSVYINQLEGKGQTNLLTEFALLNTDSLKGFGDSYINNIYYLNAHLKHEINIEDNDKTQCWLEINGVIIDLYEKQLNQENHIIQEYCNMHISNALPYSIKAGSSVIIDLAYDCSFGIPKEASIALEVIENDI